MNQKAKEFSENRTSWKWFWNKYNKRHSVIDAMNTPAAFEMLVMLEILKELQYMNDRKKIS